MQKNYCGLKTGFRLLDAGTKDKLKHVGRGKQKHEKKSNFHKFSSSKKKKKCKHKLSPCGEEEMLKRRKIRTQKARKRSGKSCLGM